jgi:hypothetical protein
MGRAHGLAASQQSPDSNLRGFELLGGPLRGYRRSAQRRRQRAAKSIIRSCCHQRVVSDYWLTPIGNSQVPFQRCCIDASACASRSETKSVNERFAYGENDRNAVRVSLPIEDSRGHPQRSPILRPLMRSPFARDRLGPTQQRASRWSDDDKLRQWNFKGGLERQSASRAWSALSVLSMWSLT